MSDSAMEKFSWLAVTCLSYGITYGIAQLPGADTYSWVGGAVTFFIMGLMIRNVFTEVGIFTAYTASAFFCAILMFPLNRFFTVLMIIILVIAFMIFVMLMAFESQRNDSY